MGPYCEHCGNRCFVYFPRGTPDSAIDAYDSAFPNRTVTIIATCPSGQKAEKERTGWCYDDIMAAVQYQAILKKKKELSGE